MKQILRSSVIILIILQSPLVLADYLDNSCHTKSKPTIFSIFSKIKRLYIGKEKTYKCLHLKVEQCIKRLGKPNKTEAISEHENRLIFYGTKQLYRGTGMTNESIGYEWREMRVINEKVVDEYSAVQILEDGYSWMIEEQTDKYLHACRQYGKCNTLMCTGLTPIKPIPKLPDRPKFTRDYTNKELTSSYMLLVGMSACGVLSKEYQYKSTDILAKWRKSNFNLINIFENSPEYPIDVISYKKLLEDVPTKHQRRIKRYCDSTISRVKNLINEPDSRFSSSEKTWALFMLSLKKGDKDTAVACLTGNAHQKLTPLFESLTKPQLQEMAESFTIDVRR